MHKKTAVYLWAILLGSLLNQPAFAVPLPCEAKLAESAIPQDAFYLPESQASQLQNALNTYKVVRLKPAGDYRRSLTIKLGSNQALYGLADTKLPNVIIPEGTSNAILSGVSPAKISFIGFTKPIHDNCFNRISNSKIFARNVRLENNRFFDLSNFDIDIDTSKRGYLKDNRFLRTMIYGLDYKIKINGDSAKQSQDNQFIWTNILTASGEGIIIKNQKNVSFIGLDAESWNWGHRAIYPGMMNVFNTDFLSIFLPIGSDYHNKTGQYFNLDAKNIVLQEGIIGASQKPGIILGEAVENFLTIYTYIPPIGLLKSNDSTQVIDLFNSINNLRPSLPASTQTVLTENLTDTAKNAMSELLQSEKNVYSVWDKPVFKPIPDPAGPEWQVDLSKQPDSADSIQDLIDQNGIAELEAGIYYISKPLLLKDGQGIVGAGADKTAIIAKSPTIDLIAGDTHLNDRVSMVTSFKLADLTLQGGRNGINHSGDGSGRGADYHRVTLSHVTFRDMENAGIFINNIYAWDNNFIDYTNFYRCKTGIKQRPSPAKDGDSIGITFLDKNVFYQTQFVENEMALDWQAGRGNNLDAFINSRFKNNRLTLNLYHTDSAFFANSVFETTSEQPLLHNNRVTSFVNSYFVSKSVLFDGNVYCNHCIFDNSAANAGLIVSPTSKYSYFINSTLAKAVNQTINTGLIINSNFSDIPQKPFVNSVFLNNTVQTF